MLRNVIIDMGFLGYYYLVIYKSKEKFYLLKRV